jgi:uncharacterized membrane protein YidH (DUF202 family)
VDGSVLKDKRQFQHRAVEARQDSGSAMPLLRGANKEMKYLQFKIGIALLVLGMLFDDLSTIIFFSLGLHFGEGNPIFQKLGVPGLVLLAIAGYSYIIWFWYNVSYKKPHQYKNYYSRNIALYTGCLLIVVLFFIKVFAGINNYGFIYGYLTDNPEIVERIEATRQLSEGNPEYYRQEMTSAYFQKVNSVFTYFSTIFLLYAVFLLYLCGKPNQSGP